MAGVLAPHGIAICGLPLDHAELEPRALPDGINSGRYFLYRRR
jgi:hypothetical protein